MNIRTVFREGTGDMFTVRVNRIRIYSKFTRGRGNKGTDDLYALVFHELGHQSHWKLNRYRTAVGQRILRESWAEYIEHIFIQQYYPNTDSDKQGEDRDEMSNGYSALFIDLADDNNQRRRNGGSKNFPNDNVIGYSPRQMQSAVRTSRKLEHVRDYLRDKYNNRTEHHLNELFDFYIDIQ